MVDIMSYFKTVKLQSLVDDSNSTTTPLGVDGVFTGSWIDTSIYGTCTLGVMADQDSAEDGLKISYSDDGISEIQNDVFTIYANIGKTFSFGMANRYLRLIYTNGGVEQTSFNLQLILKTASIKASSHRINDVIVGEDDAELIKAVITGQSTDDPELFVNGKFTSDGSQLVKLVDSENNKEIYISPTRDLRVVNPVRLVGTGFNGVKDTNFWTETVVGTGSATAGGQITLSTGTTANSSVTYTSVRKGRYTTGSFNQFRCIAQTDDNPVENNLRRIGCFNSTDGYFFQINGTTFQIGSRKASSDTLVSSGSFNGSLGSTYALDNDIHRLYIDLGNQSVYFYIDDKLLHRLTSNTPLSNTLTLPITFQNTNSGGLDSNITFNVRTASIMRLGSLQTNPTYKSIITNTTSILKYGAGVLHKIINCDNAGTVVVYDNTAASGNVIAQIDSAKALGTLDFNAPFSNGLTVVSAGGAKITVIYE